MASSGSTIRLFYGIYLDATLRDAVVELQKRLQRSTGSVKWVEADNLHFTLRFMGDIPNCQVADLIQAGRATAQVVHGFDLHLRGAGAFPTPANPRTVWLGVTDGAAQMTDLHSYLTHVLHETGLAEPENRRFSPHCTLGRARQSRRDQALAAALNAHAAHDIGPMRCEQFCLIHSTLHSSGPTYRVVETFALRQYNTTDRGGN